MGLDPRIDRRSLRTSAAAWTCRSGRGVVACANFQAADVGAEVLANGGNAADAAVATALALGVAEPAASGLGGMAMATVHGFGSGEPFCLEGACRAPALATPEAVAASHRYRGRNAIAVPMAVAVWQALHTRCGRLPLAEVVRPVVALARTGRAITPLQVELAETYRAQLLRSEIADLAFDDQSRPYQIGAVVPQPVLADTIERLGAHGFTDFYRGSIARAIDRDMVATGGFVRLADLRAVGEVKPRAPLVLRMRDRRVFTAGPPAGGLTLLQLLGMVDVLGRVPDPRDPDDAVLIAAMIRRAREDRRRYRLRIGSQAVDRAAELLEPSIHRRALKELLAAEGLGETSHLCAMDASGATVSMTVSIERSFGSGCMTRDLGFVYNGYLRGFKVQNRRHPHFLRPGAVARSNAAPTIVVEDGGTVTAIGSTGSERMVSGIFTTLLRLERESPFEAVAGPRLHATPDGELLIEAERFDPATRRRLAERFQIRDTGPWAFKFGGLQLAQRRGGEMLAVGEPRRDGGASAPPG